MDYIHVYIHACMHVCINIRTFSLSFGKTLIVPKLENKVFRLLWVCMWCAIMYACGEYMWRVHVVFVYVVCVLMRVRSLLMHSQTKCSVHVVSMHLNKSKKKHELRRNMLNNVMHE